MARGKKNAAGSHALFEVTVTWHPQVLRDFLISANGLWGYLSVFFLTIFWTVLFAALQLSMAEYFPQYPLYPLPVVIGYFAWKRTRRWAFVASFLAGVVLDSLTFQPLGPAALIGMLSAGMVMLFEKRFGSPEKHFSVRCLLDGGVATFVFMLFKLMWMSFVSPRGDALSMFPKHVLFGSILSAVFLSPLMFSVMDVVEWLLRVPRPHRGAAEQ